MQSGRLINADGTGFYTCKECHKTESLSNHASTNHKEGEQLENGRSVGARSCNFGDGTDQRVQSLMMMMMMMIGLYEKLKPPVILYRLGGFEL